MLWRKEVEYLPFTNSNVPPAQGSPRSVQLRLLLRLIYVYAVAVCSMSLTVDSFE